VGVIPTIETRQSWFVATFFGFGFSGMIPAYVLAIRGLFPASEATWRVPTLLLFSGSGMAAGGWLAGVMSNPFRFQMAPIKHG